MWTYALTFAGGVAVGVILEKIIETYNSSGKDKSKTLEKLFGEPMQTDNFTISEVKEWISARQNLLEQGAKAVVMKINDSTLKSVGKDIKCGTNIENMLLVVIVNTETKDIKDSVLVKYRALDIKLEQMLDNGNGTVVVEV